VPGGAEALRGFLARAELPHKDAGEGRIAVQLRGERKLTIPVMIAIGTDDVRFETFFMRKPMENRDAFYEMLLRRNMRARGVAFAIDAAGDVYLVGSLPADALDDDRLDRIFGAILVEADGMFDAAIGVGFESYLAADMAWRARQP
jgi:hypothetical protein